MLATFVNYVRTKANFICLYIQGFIFLSGILHAVKCQAISSPNRVTTNPIAGYIIYSNTIKNIQQNPNVALLIDEYNEDWRKLYFIMIQGNASIIGGKELEKNEMVLLEKAHKLLSRKYLQYHEIGIGEYVIMIVPQKVITWKNV